MPYTYLIGWSNQNKFYYGVRYSKICHPNDLWVTYFTSSKYVKEFRQEHGEPDIIEIRKTFNSNQSAIIWEEKVLRKIIKSNTDKWLNKNISGAIIYTSDVLNKLRYIRTEENKTNLKIARKKLMNSGFRSPNPSLREDVKMKMSENKKINYVGKGNPMYGKKHTEETKLKISLSAKNRKRR